MLNEELVRLVEECREGRPRAQEALFRRLYPFAMSVALRYSSGQHDAADMLSCAFFKMFKSLHSYDASRGCFEAWIKKIIIHEAIDHINANRKNNRRVSLESITGPPVDNDVLSKLDVRLLMKLIQGLPPQRRIIFNLFVIEGYSHSEISRQTGLNINTCRWHLAESKKQLQQQIRELK